MARARKDTKPKPKRKNRLKHIKRMAKNNQILKELSGK
jgi:hypothetical protein